MNLVNTTYISTRDVINKLQRLKGKTKLKLFEIISKYYDTVNIRFDEDLFDKLFKVLVKFIMKYWS